MARRSTNSKASMDRTANKLATLFENYVANFPAGERDAKYRGFERAVNRASRVRCAP